ncbi:D-sedoheptulose 7-phosphate isomerase [Candidatus Pseudothioglobus singularis]|jgi:D-sedoheptulose 7-phosphate isomerase|nr:D-sedoheptulose 7-phosphate isomerase [Candidatus Pseudothioglobus singularis]
MQSIIKQEFIEHSITVDATLKLIGLEIEIAANICIESLKQGGKILLFGNGGSAADAQHIAAELVGKYQLERKGLSAIALTTDTSALTAIANDFGYEHIFDRQIAAMAKPKDVVFGISTSGNSSNVINALELANNIGCKSIGLSGKFSLNMQNLCDVNIAIPATNTARIQEMHILVGHIICNLIDLEYKDSQ